MRRILGALLVGVAAIAVGVAVAAALLLYTGTGREYLRGLLVARLNDQITGRLTIVRLEGDLPNDVVLRDVALRDSAGTLVLGVDRIAARVNVMQLFSKR